MVFPLTIKTSGGVMMSKIIIIADDLTGANATGVLLVQQGFKAATFINLDKYNSLQNDDYDIVTINTDSRAIKREEAYKRVKSIVEFFKDEDVTLFSKRIDSTFRGNIGAEISAILDNVKDDTYAIVVPSFPASGRTCVGGYLMVHQVPLEKTPVATDPKTPVLTSKVVNLLEEQMQEKIGYVELGKVLKGTDSIKNSIIDQIGKGYRIIVVDATTNDDIINIARAVKNTGLSVISADPGPFTAALSAELLDIPEGEKGKKVLMTIGSISGLTKKQLDEFKMEYKTFIVEVNASNLLYKETTLSEDNILDLRMIAKEEKISEDEVSQKISGGLAEITVKTLEKSNSLLRGLYISGGDVTVAVCNALGAAAIEVKDEVLPLAVYGRIIDGTYHNMPIITKGGLVGDEKAIIKCVNYMFTKLSNDYHTIKR